MELVLNNPYRVLGLQSTASARDIIKRVSDLETFAELGKIKSFPMDFPMLGNLDRSLDAVKDAERKIEHPEGRLFHSFFWFRSGDSVDDLALDCLATGNFDEAIDIFNKQIGKKGYKKYTWRLNRAVIRLLKATQDTLNRDELDEALEDIGFVIDDELEHSIEDVLLGNESGIDRENVWRRVADDMVGLAQSCPEKPYGNSAIQIVDSFWSFPTESREYVSSKIVNPLIEKVREAIKVSEELRSDDNLNALKAKNYLDKVEDIITDLQDTIGEDDIRFQTVANAYADEVCDCAIKALNQFEDVKLAMLLIKWAHSLPSFSRVSLRIEENMEAIQEWLENKEEEEIFDNVIQKLKIELKTLNQAATMFENMRKDLALIKAKVGQADDRYITVSSACSFRILDFLIDTVNSAQEKFKSNKNFVELQSIIAQSAGLTRKLLFLDLDAEAKVRVNKNLETIEGLNVSLSNAMRVKEIQAESSNSIWGKIPVWLWVVGVITLVSMCRG